MKILKYLSSLLYSCYQGEGSIRLFLYRKKKNCIYGGATEWKVKANTWGGQLGHYCCENA